MFLQNNFTVSFAWLCLDQHDNYEKYFTCISTKKAKLGSKMIMFMLGDHSFWPVSYNYTCSALDENIYSTLLEIMDYDDWHMMKIHVITNVNDLMT